MSDDLKTKRVFARCRLALFVTSPTARMALELVAPDVLKDIETVLQDLTERDTRHTRNTSPPRETNVVRTLQEDDIITP